MARTYFTNRTFAVYWEGWDEVLADLRSYGSTLPRLLVQGELQAAEIGAGRARTAATSLGGTARHVAPSIEPGATQHAAYIALGGSQYPMAAGAEFGAYHDMPRETKRGIVHGWNQFPSWKGSGPSAGYFLMPTIRDSEDDMLAKLDVVFNDIERRVFNE